MKKLIVSVSKKKTSEILEEFKTALEKAYAGTLKPHYEISFRDRKDFNRFIENVHVLSSIRALKPHSIYELAKQTDMDLSNLSKIILFFEEQGVVRIKEEVVSGRKVRRLAG
jgi:predicted transcriptional regulator